MARNAMVTRTITFTYVKAISVDVESRQVIDNSYRLIGDYEGEKAIMKKLESMGEKVVAITEVEKENKLYGMTEEDFVLWAHEMESRNKTL